MMAPAPRKGQIRDAVVEIAIEVGKKNGRKVAANCICMDCRDHGDLAHQKATKHHVTRLTEEEQELADDLMEMEQS